MKGGRIQFLAVVCFAAAIGVARGSWYDDYGDGIKAARAGQWAKVVDNMTKAIRGNAKEANNARTYGAIFINYKPFYYRGIANLNLGKYEQAISDLEKTMGPGELDLGPIDTHIKRAKEAGAAPLVIVDPTPPQPPVPVTPTIDSALRLRAEAAVRQARERVQAAQQRKATESPDYKNAQRQYADANMALAGADSNAELNRVIAMAENAALMADSANAPSVVTTTQTVTTTTSKPVVVADVVLADSKQRLRKALESYFDGDFDKATRDFDRLTREMPRNPWVWAFLGASQWSLYAFETEEQYKRDAIRSFKKARSLRSWKGGLPQKYFSRRIRNAFDNTAG